MKKILASGIIAIIVSAAAFVGAYKSHHPPTLAINDGEILIYLSHGVGVWMVLAVVLGAAGIVLTGYYIMRHREDEKRLDDMLSKHGKK
jgi:hypothetical protein